MENVQFHPPEILSERYMVPDRNSAPYAPYQFLFEVGDLVRLKAGPEYQQTHERLMQHLPAHWGPQSWIPTMETIEKCSGLTFEVKVKNSFHLGIPLYFLSAHESEESHTIRVFEGFLESAE